MTTRRLLTTLLLALALLGSAYALSRPPEEPVEGRLFARPAFAQRAATR